MDIRQALVMAVKSLLARKVRSGDYCRRGGGYCHYDYWPGHAGAG